MHLGPLSGLAKGLGRLHRACTIIWAAARDVKGNIEASMDAKADRKTKKSTLLSWKCGDWIEIVESERKSGTIFVTSIQCKICMKHQKKLMTLRNFNAAWCRDRGTTNVKKDSVLTHMKGEPNKLAMKLEQESEFTKQPGPLPSYAVTPLGKAFFKLNQQERERG